MTATPPISAKVKLTVEDFDILAESGGLAGLERTELLDGDIYLMAPQYSRHSNAKALFQEALIDWTRAHCPDLVVRTETSVAMPLHDEPMPDVIVCTRPRARRGIPVETVSLLVEIATGSAEDDLGRKAKLYAEQGVPEYWVVDLQDEVVVQHALPSPNGYAAPERIAFGKRVDARTLAGLSVDTSELVDPLD